MTVGRLVSGAKRPEQLVGIWYMGLGKPPGPRGSSAWPPLLCHCGRHPRGRARSIEHPRAARQYLAEDHP
jgi:hypothetical protein